MDRRMAKAVAGHFRSAAHGEIHFALLLHLFHVIIGDMMSDRLLTHDNELPMAVRCRLKEPSARSREWF
jgi:hypothetical protein